MSLTSLLITASESTDDPAIPAVVVGGLALGVLLAALTILLIIGGGREHS